MQRISKASLAFKNKRPADKPPFGANVINCLRAAATTFPDLPISLTELQRVNNALLLAVTSALSGNHSAVAQVKLAATQWNEAFGEAANYVSTVAAGSQPVITSAGFVPTKSESQPAQKPAAASNFKATINGSKGAIIAGSKNAVPEAKAYVFCAAQDGVQVSYADNALIISAGGKNIYVSAGTQRQTEFYNLPSAVPFNVSMYAINSAGSGPAAAAQQVVTQ